jgi:hypothetical protein
MSSYTGNFFFLTLSVVVLTTGFLRFIKTEKTDISLLFYLIVSSELVGSISVQRIELLSLGILFWCVSLLKQKKEIFLSGLFIATALSWKLQLLPCFAFLLIVMRHDIKLLLKFISGFLVGLIANISLPFLFFQTTFALSLYRSWISVLGETVQVMWPQYASSFAFTHQYFSFPNFYWQIQVFTLLFACVSCWFVYRFISCKNYLAAMAMGTLFTSLFSPLSQGAAFILHTPVLIEILRKKRDNLMYFLLVTYWFLASLIFSDLVPFSWRSFANAHKTRPIAVLILLLVYLVITSQEYYKKLSLRGAKATKQSPFLDDKS